LNAYAKAGAQPGGGLSRKDIWPFPKISKYCLAILTFAETFKEKDEILYSKHFKEKSYSHLSLSY